MSIQGNDLSLRMVAEAEAARMREANPAQYFERNLHQLGFSDPEHAMLQTIKEMLDNSLDATELGKILPELTIEIEDMGEEITLPSQAGKIRKADLFRVRVQDNGIGIMPEKVARSLGKLLFGSKLFTMKQTRGQQGIGISAVILYSQLSSLRPATVISKVAGSEKARRVALKIDVERNEPIIVEESDIQWDVEHGTSVEVFLPGRYDEKLERYIKELSIGNPNARILVMKKIADTNSEIVVARTSQIIPREAHEIKPHLTSVDPGILQRMAEMDDDCRTIASFLAKHFAVMSPKTARKILQRAMLPPSLKPRSIKADRILKAARRMNLRRPRLDVLSNIGENELKASIRNLFPDAEFIEAVSRPPWSYQGIPFQIEAAAAAGGSSVQNYSQQKKMPVIRLANRVPLPYDSADCELYKAVVDIDWKNYGLETTDGGEAAEPIVFVTSLVASKVPYSNPGKFAVASVLEIHEELTLALQELGRRIREYLHRKRREESVAKRYEYFHGYYEILSEEVRQITGVENLSFNSTLERIFSQFPPDREEAHA